MGISWRACIPTVSQRSCSCDRASHPGCSGRRLVRCRRGSRHGGAAHAVPGCGADLVEPQWRGKPARLAGACGGDMVVDPYRPAVDGAAGLAAFWVVGFGVRRGSGVVVRAGRGKAVAPAELGLRPKTRQEALPPGPQPRAIALGTPPLEYEALSPLTGSKGSPLAGSRREVPALFPERPRPATVPTAPPNTARPRSRGKVHVRINARYGPERVVQSRCRGR